MKKRLWLNKSGYTKLNKIKYVCLLFFICLCADLLSAFNIVLYIANFQKEDILSIFPQISSTRKFFLLKYFLTSYRTLTEGSLENKALGSVV